MTSAPLLCVHIATLLFGLAGVLGAVSGLGAIEVTFGRTVFATLALLLVCRGMKISTTEISTHGSRWLLLISGVLLAFHWVSFFAAIQYSTVAIGLVTFSTCPVFTALLEPVVFKEKWRVVNLLAALLVLVGVLIISGVTGGELRYGQGIFLGLLSGLSFAVLQLLNRQLANVSGALVTATIQNAVAALVLLPVVFFSIVEFAFSQWVILLVLGVVCTAFAHTLFINSLKQVKVSTASLITAGLEPVYGVVIAVFVLSQKPSLNVIVGGLIVLLPVLYVTSRESDYKQA